MGNKELYKKNDNSKNMGKHQINNISEMEELCESGNKSEVIQPCEDKTKYGETIPSMFTWITPSEQKERANELNEMTKKKK